MLDALKKTLNIAGAQTGVETEREAYAQGDRVAGAVRITAPASRRAGDAIELALKEFWTETRSTGKSTTVVVVDKTHETVVLHGPFDFESTSTHTFPFEVHIPVNGRISTKDAGWNVTVSMKIPKAIDPSGQVVLDVSPGRAISTVVTSCEQRLGFAERRDKRSWSQSTLRTSIRLLPPVVLKSELDFLTLALSETTEGGVEGELIFNLQEKRLRDHLRNLLGKGKVRWPITLSQQDVFQPDGSANDARIVRAIGTVLRSVVEQEL